MTTTTVAMNGHRSISRWQRRRGKDCRNDWGGGDGEKEERGIVGI